MPACPECCAHCCTMQQLSLHLRMVHATVDTASGLSCREPGCHQRSSNWAGFRKHSQRHHLLQCNHECVNPSQDGELPAASFDTSTVQEDAHVTVDVDYTNQSVDIKDELLIFAAKLYANSELPRSHVQVMVSEVSGLFGTYVEKLKSSIKLCLLQAEVPENVVKKVNNILDDSLQSFQCVSSEYRRMKAFEETDCIVPIQEIVIGSRIEDKLRASVMVKETVPVTVSYIPMKNVLQHLFGLPNVFSSVKTYVENLEAEHDVLENFIQGDLWKKKVSDNFQGKYVLPLFLYFDDFEINNPLGSHAGIQKIGALYYTVGCFPPEVRAQLENLFTVMLFNSYDRVEFGNRRIFQTVIDELNFLQSEGILVDTSHGQERVYFALGLILGDNLGLNSILGFVESFNAHYYCRLCLTHKEVVQYESVEKRLRIESCDLDAQNIALGMKEECVWNSVLNFSVESNFSVDWLHDGPEGWFKHLMTLILHYFVMDVLPTSSRLSLSILNSRMNSYQYSKNGLTNQPPSITPAEVAKKQLKMSGSEMQNFILVFAMFAGDLVSVDDEVWKLYLLMRRIMDIVNSRGLQKGYTTILQSLVSQHLLLFMKLFPHERIKPKGHNFLHYPTVFKQCGPITNLSSFRYEANHRLKKKAATATASRKNILKTLCTKEQLALCYRFMANKGLTPSIDYGPYVSINSNSNFSTLVPPELMGPSVSYSWIQVNGVTYSENTTLVVGMNLDDDTPPIFGTVKHILQEEDGAVWLICKVFQTIAFHDEFHAYHIAVTDNFVCASLDSLISPHPVIKVERGNLIYATVKHSL